MRGANGLAPQLGTAGRAVVGIAIALASAVLAACWGDTLVRWMLPAMRGLLHALMPEFRLGAFEVYDGFGQAQLHAQMLLTQPLQIGHRLVDRPVLAAAQLTLGAFWQPVAVAIASAALVTYEFGQRPMHRGRAVTRPSRARATALFASLGWGAVAAAVAGALATALSVVLAPSMLAGMMIGDIYWHEASDQIIPHIVRLPRFLEEGGWLMLGLMVGIVVGAAVGAGRAAARAGSAAEPHCGSQ